MHPFQGGLNEEPCSIVLGLSKGNGTFEDISVSSGIRKAHMGKGLAVRFCDFDDDGYGTVVYGGDACDDFANCAEYLATPREHVAAGRAADGLARPGCPPRRTPASATDRTSPAEPARTPGA